MSGHSMTMRSPIRRPAPKNIGDELGRIRCERGVSTDEAIARARRMPWWPRVRSTTPRLSHRWWCWPLKPEVQR